MSSIADRIEWVLNGNGYRLFGEVEPLLRDALEELRAHERRSKLAGEPAVSRRLVDQAEWGAYLGQQIEQAVQVTQRSIDSLGELSANLRKPMPGASGHQD